MADKNYIPKYNYDDYLLWEGDWELIYGNPIAMSPSPKYKHQELGGILIEYFRRALKERHKSTNCNCKVIYELDWKVNDETIVRPDLAIVCENKIEDYLVKPPHLIIEILSKSTQLIDRNTKFSLYESCGVRYYLMAEPESKEIEIFELIDNQYKSIHHSNFTLNKNCSITIDFEKVFGEMSA